MKEIGPFTNLAGLGVGCDDNSGRETPQSDLGLCRKESCAASPVFQAGCYPLQTGNDVALRLDRSSLKVGDR